MEVFIASIYKYVYILVVAFVTLNFLPFYRSHKFLGNSGAANRSNAYLLLVVTVLFIGLRPVNEQYFADMAAYAYQLRRYASALFVYNWNTDNKIFDNLLLWWASERLGDRAFFILMSTLYFSCAYIGLRRLFPGHIKIAFLVFLAAFSTFSYGTNGLKAGVASSIFIMALGFKDKKAVSFALLLVSLGFHHSMILPIAAYMVSMLFKNAKWYYYGWIFCFIMCCLHVSYFQNLFAGLSDEQGAMYLLATEQTTDAHIGFRPDFILYSAVPVWMGYRLEMKGRNNLSETCKFLIHLYITANAVWLLCMYASFNNRIAYLSWCIYPIVVICPFLDKENKDPLRYIKLDKSVRYHLYFTMFMSIVYYGLLSLGR